MIHYVRVAVALSRPPKIDEWRRYCVVAATRQEAELIAQQMAACTSVMPVESHWESSHRAGPVEPFGALGCTCWGLAWAEDLGDDNDTWQIGDNCPHHSEDIAAWAALDAGADTMAEAIGEFWNPPSDECRTEPAECPPGVHSVFDFCPGDCNEPVDHGIRSAECEAGTCDCDGFIPPTADRLMEVQGVMGSIGGENPPTPETANAGGPDIDDTPVTGTRKWDGVKWAEASTSKPYATGAIVPDELKRKPWIDPATFGEAMAPRKITLSMPAHPLDTVKVSCMCERIDVSTWLDGPAGHTVRGRTHGDCPLHGDLAQIRAFGHIDVGDRLRVNSFGIWSIDRYNHFTNTVKPGLLSPTLSPGKIKCVSCDDWSHSYGTAPGSSATALAAYMTHRTTVTESGLTECRSLSQPQPTTWWRRLLRLSAAASGGYLAD